MTVPATLAAPILSVKTPTGVIEAPLIAVLKVAVIFRLKGTAVAPSAGFVELIVGGSRFTRKVTELLVPKEVVTVTF